MKLTKIVLAALLFSPALALGQAAGSPPAAPAPLASLNDIGLGSYLYNQGLMIANNSHPTMVRDFVNNEWLYGATYQFYQSNKMLPRLVPPKFRDALAPKLPPVNFSGGLIAPVGSKQGTPVVESSLDLTPVMKSGLMAVINKLPANLDKHLGVVGDMLKTDANGAGILALGFAAGRDFNQGLWRAGASMKLSVKFGGTSSSNNNSGLLPPASDGPSASNPSPAQ